MCRPSFPTRHILIPPANMHSENEYPRYETAHKWRHTPGLEEGVTHLYALILPASGCSSCNLLILTLGVGGFWSHLKSIVTCSGNFTLACAWMPQLLYISSARYCSHIQGHIHEIFTAKNLNCKKGQTSMAETFPRWFSGYTLTISISSSQ